MNSTLTTDILVIGAGPAGLSFGYSFSKYSKNFLIIDMGKPLDLRERYDPLDCLCGEGGAGFFSDGKFSFFPSGTYVWQLKNGKALEQAYKDLGKAFKDSVQFDIPQFPDYSEIEALNTNGRFELKTYPSFYIPIEKRKKLLQHMTGQFAKSIMFGWMVTKWTKEDDGCYYVEAQNKESSENLVIKCKKIILGGGRFHPLFLKQNKIPMTFKRYELGIRFYGKNNYFDSIQSKQTIDPKWLYRPQQNIEFRTFCMCVDGEYIASNFMGIQSVSGRADVPSTGMTNFGLTMRLKDEAVKEEEFQKVLKCEPFEIEVTEYLKDKECLVKLYGKQLSDKYEEGLRKFINDFNLVTKELKMVGPSTEGVGEYPKIDMGLKVEGEDIYAIGDCSGIFRGIIPSMISGHYLGLDLIEKLNEDGK